jgi:hypothetical protein
MLVKDFNNPDLSFVLEMAKKKGVPIRKYDTKEITKIELFNNTYLVSFALWLDTETDFSLNTKYYHYNEIAKLLENSKKIKNR